MENAFRLEDFLEAPKKLKLTSIKLLRADEGATVVSLKISFFQCCIVTGSWKKSPGDRKRLSSSLAIKKLRRFTKA